MLLPAIRHSPYNVEAEGTLSRGKRVLRVVALILVGVAGSHAAAAQEGIRNSPDPDRLKAAEALYDASDEGKRIEVWQHEMIKTYSERLIKAAGNASSATEERVERLVAPDFSSVTTALKHSYLLEMATSLRAKDMMEIVTFLNSPVGRRYLAVVPAMLKSHYEAVSEAFKAMESTFSQRHKNEFAKLGLVFKGSAL